MSPFDAAASVNEMPMSYLNYGTPREAFKALKVEQPKSNNGLEADPAGNEEAR
jgi:hypothetical protein